MMEFLMMVSSKTEILEKENEKTSRYKLFDQTDSPFLATARELFNANFDSPEGHIQPIYVSGKNICGK